MKCTDSKSVILNKVILFSVTPFSLTINRSTVQIVFHGIVQYLLKFAIALCRMCI